MFGLTHWVHVVQVIHKVSLSQVNCHLQTNHSVSFQSLTLITTADDDWISWSETISDVTVNRNWYKCGNASFDTTIFTTITK